MASALASHACTVENNCTGQKNRKHTSFKKMYDLNTANLSYFKLFVISRLVNECFAA